MVAYTNESDKKLHSRNILRREPVGYREMGLRQGNSG